MRTSKANRIVCLALIGALTCTTTVYAQDFSPYFEKTGRGAYDLYRDTLLCNAVLDWAIAADPGSKLHPELDKGVTYTEGFALFLLETGNVVDTGGSILAPGNLPTDRRNAQADWQGVLAALRETNEAPEAEIDRCLRRYGHDWE